MVNADFHPGRLRSHILNSKDEIKVSREKSFPSAVPRTCYWETSNIKAAMAGVKRIPILNRHSIKLAKKCWSWTGLYFCCAAERHTKEQKEHVQLVGMPEYFRCAIEAYLENCNKAVVKALSPLPARNTLCCNKPFVWCSSWGPTSITSGTTGTLQLLINHSFLSGWSG